MHSSDRTVALVLLAVGLAAAPAAAQERAWLDANLGAAVASEDTYLDSVDFLLRDETATASTNYSLPSGSAFDVGGGWMFHPRFGVGITVGGTAHDDVAELTAVIPHPGIVNAHATATATTDIDLRRRERAVHLHAAVLLAPSDASFSLRLFGGPTHFTVRQDVVEDIVVLESLTGAGFAVAIVDFDLVEETEGSAWGVHVGADARYFFTERIGVGAMLRVSRADVEIPGLFAEPADIKAGGMQIGGGLRLRF